MYIEDLRVVEKKEDLRVDVVYYSNEYERKGNKYLNWTRFYNKYFEIVEDVKVRYTNAISELKEIVEAEHKDDIALAAYDLEKLNNKFYLVKSNENTDEALKAIAESVKPKNWN